MRPQNGDVLVSNSSATAEYDVTIIGGPVDCTGVNYSGAIARAQQLARQHRTDAWLTEDHSHFLQIAFCRDAINARL